MAPRTNSQWDHKSDKDLLLAIIDTGAIKAINWKTIAETMALKGYTFTLEACRQHFQKIRKESRGGATSTNNTQNRSQPKGTPKKRAGGKSLPGYNDDDDDDGDDELFTPSKRAKLKKEEDPDNGGLHGQSAPLFKVEDLTGQGVIDLENEDLYEV